MNLEERTRYPKTDHLWMRFENPPKMRGVMRRGHYSHPEFNLVKFWHVQEKIDGCLSYEQPVMTDRGPIRIGMVVNRRMNVRVLSYNESTKQVEYRKIIRYHKEKRVRDFINVVVKSRGKGSRPKSIVCTGNHQIYSGGQWVMAKDLIPGQTISHLTSGVATEIKQIILGTLLGDGGITRPSRNTRGISIVHSVAQEDYFEFKKHIFGKLFRETTSQRGGFPGSKLNRRGNITINNEISELIIENCEIDRKKKVTERWARQLTPLSIAIWYMDDGTANFNDNQRPRVRFSTNGFSWSEVEILQKMFKKKYDIESKIFDYKGPTLNLSSDGTEKLFSMIFPYICKGMKYKMPLRYRHLPCCLENISLLEIPVLIDTVVIRVTDKLPRRNLSGTAGNYQYDLTVEHNSNYFSNAILVHNSNIRVMLRHVGGKWCVDLFTREGTDYNISWKGARTFLREKFTLDRIFAGIDEKKIDTSSIVVFYGELFGAGINKDGELYSDKLEYAVFDIKIDDWWLTPEQVIDVVHKMGIRHAPIISEMMTIDDIVSFVSSFPDSRIDPRREMEGVVCRASPMFMFKGTNNPVQFKLKAREMRRTIEYEKDQRKFK